ncbi:MAG: DUF362 domain-containing protein [Candidatus Daviesbacteria bacterium]|nr:DUF362 domain-containing protein [Candidatus Daviesbacteria bacterium]
MNKIIAEVKVASCQQYEKQEVEKSMTNIIKDLFQKSKFEKGDRILIKPNILRKASLQSGTTTHPVILECVIEALLGSGLEVTIADSPGGSKSNTLTEFLEICEATGIVDITKKYPSVKLAFINAGIREGKFIIYRNLRDYDKILNIAKLKTHILTYFSGAVKNIFGLVPGKHKLDYHAKFPQRRAFSKFIMELFDHITPTYNILDGIIGMEGDGPSKGSSKYAGVLLGSNNGFAVDEVAMGLTGLNSLKCLYMKDNLEIKLEGDLPSKTKFKEPITAMRGVNLCYYLENIERFNNLPIPLIKENYCVGCGTCMKICPESAIQIIKNVPRIDYDKCIKCYCCYELSGCKAIELRVK